MIILVCRVMSSYFIEVKAWSPELLAWSHSFAQHGMSYNAMSLDRQQGSYALWIKYDVQNWGISVCWCECRDYFRENSPKHNVLTIRGGIEASCISELREEFVIIQSHEFNLKSWRELVGGLLYIEIVVALWDMIWHFSSWNTDINHAHRAQQPLKSTS